MVRDEIPNGNDGSTTLGPVWVESRPDLGYALSYDNDDWIHISDSSSLNPSELTVEAWVYPRSFAAGSENDWAKIIVEEEIDEDGYYSPIIDGGHPQAQLRIGETLYIA